MNLKTINVARYVTPLREGGSLPAIIEDDEQKLYVLKFRGAGQGPKALIAELVSGEIGRVLGFRVPEIAFAELDTALAKTEPDPEIQDLINFSGGLNLAVEYLSGSITYDPLMIEPEARAASEIVWFDAFTANVDRTPRNANILYWQDNLWLIDHGAALYFHHNWERFPGNVNNPFPLIKDHILLAFANQIEEADQILSQKLSPQILAGIVELIPDQWLEDPTGQRKVYLEFLTRRLELRDAFVKEAINARKMRL